MTNDFELSGKELLLLHQLQTADFWSRRSKRPDEENAAPGVKKMPAKWRMTRGVELYSWQRECLEKYPGRGIAHVVTGAGKTLFALALIEKLQAERKDLKVIIVVPTIVLMKQWLDVILRHGNLPASAIGRLGGGSKDSLDDCAILIGVCNSVATFAEKIGDRYRDRLLFIADECHRYKGEVMRQIFNIGRRYSLGLSATPDVEPGGSDNDEYDDDTALPSSAPSAQEDILTRELGGIFFTLNYDDAVREHFLPEFEIRHVGLPLTGDENSSYRRISDEVTNLRDRLFAIFPDAPRGGELGGWASRKLERGKLGEEAAAVCAQYIGKVAERATLLYHAVNREIAVMRFLREHLKRDRKTQVILFHQRIDEIMRLYRILVDGKIAAVAEHSKLSDNIRGNSISLFRRGIARVIVSGKSLIEGFDAPAADCGINVASSGSSTQAIQSIGRILRKSGQEQAGLIIRFYIRGTTDENIYRKLDFATLTGAKRNRYFHWDPQNEAADIFADERQTPPFFPLPGENELDWPNIRPGDGLQFDADGQDYQLDDLDNLFSRDGAKKSFVANPQNLLECLRPFREKMRNNYLRQTSSGRIFIRQHDGDDRWYWVYCGRTPELFRAQPAAAAEEFKLRPFRGRTVIQQARPVGGVARNIPEPHAGKIFAAIAALPPELRDGVKKLYIADGTRVFLRAAGAERPVCFLDAPWNQ